MRLTARAFALPLALTLALAIAPAGAAPATQAPAASAASAAAASCPPDAVAPSVAESLALMRAAVDRGLLWKATRGGGTVWLYGTIHVARREWMFPGPQVMAALRASDALALELDPTDPAILERLRGAIAARPDAPALPPALESRLRADIAAACVAPGALDSLRPEMRAVSIEVLQGREDGLYPAYGIDAILAGLAHGLGKPIRSLETPEAQAALLVSDDPAETARSVAQVLDELDSGRSPVVLRRLATDWERGDLTDLDAYARWCGCLDTPDQRADFAKLVDERNPPMADHIAQWDAGGRTLFVAVGSLHLLGPVGLPELLRRRGFVVERVALRAGQ